MGFKIIVSPQATQDLAEIVRYIAPDNPAAAEKLGLQLCDQLLLLENFPRLGCVVPEFKLEHVREIIFKSYRIVYGVNDENCSIEVFHFWDGRRGSPDLPPGSIA